MACGNPPGDGVDAGGDSGVRDAGVRDSGTPDAGVRDSGVPDSGVPDSGVPDAGFDAGVDAGQGDAGVADSGMADSGFPIRHIIVIVKENHTFDNYFGTFPGANGTTVCRYSDAGTFTCPHAPNPPPRDLNHGHNSGLLDWHDGGMDGYDLDRNNVVAGNGTVDNLGYAQYLEADIPHYWAYARTYALADNFYSSYIGESFPGHLFFLAAQAAWATEDPDLPPASPYWGCDEASRCQNPDGGLVPVLCTGTVQDQTTCTYVKKPPCYDIPSVPDVLPPGVTWKFYGSNIAPPVLTEVWSMFDAISPIRYDAGWANVVPYAQFDVDVDAGTLPAVSWLVDQDLFSEHPPLSVCAGESWTVTRINEIMKSPYWNDTVIFFTMDDFGGWYDHVPPPQLYGCDLTHPYGMGFRLPLIIISPYAKPGSIFHEQSEQASIPHFIERIFGATHSLSELDPAARDGQANDLLNAFDFTQQPLPPLVLTPRVCL
jgi:phospholipase C